jgi:hypothetical protein
MLHARTLSGLLFFLATLAGVSPLWAQFNPERAYGQTEAVARHYPDPAMRFETPGFAPGKTDFTSHQEMMDFIYALQKTSSNVQVRIIGASQEGRVIPMLVFSNSGLFAAADLIRLNRPIVFLQGLQHGNEPAGGEIMLALAKDLARGALKPLLDKITVIIVPRCNPDGAYYFTRTPARGIDINRDHIKMDLPETIALHQAINEFQPEVFVDAHEFSVATRWMEKFGKLLAYDLTLLYATNPNVPAALTALADNVYRRNIVREVEGAGYSHFWYFTTSYNPADKKVSMGGTSPDIGRNTAGLQNAISFLIESRGVGIGRASYARRVHAHYVAIAGVLNTTADNAARVMDTVRAARTAVALQAAKPGPDIAVTSKNPLVTQKLAMRDPVTGELAQVEVEWDDSLAATPELVRKRPFAYVMPPAYADVARRLAYSGVEVRRLHAPLTVEVESYQVTDRRAGTVYYEGHIRSSVTTEVMPKSMTFAAGSYVYVMTQPNANVIAAALEPESPSSFVTFGIIPVDRKGAAGAMGEAPVYRLMQPVALDARLIERE